MSAVLEQIKVSGACENLKNELRKTGMKFFATYTTVHGIEVYGYHEIKAYVPKTYQGWKVRFFIWRGSDMFIDLDVPIN